MGKNYDEVGVIRSLTKVSGVKVVDEKGNDITPAKKGDA